MLGCIADDYTGATDLASALAQSGLRVVQLFGPPDRSTPLPDSGRVDAIVVALKIRTAPADDAVTQALGALSWLRRRPVDKVLFKYCSTFDSTSAGNIGPVHDAIQAVLGQTQSISTPATPENGRTVYLGHLFVGQQLLSDSDMRHHPLTPMTDSALIRVLAAQSRSDIRLLPLPVVRAGAPAVRAYLHRLADAAHGAQIVVCDALDDADLDTLADATRSLPLVAGAAGLGRAVAQTRASQRSGAELPSDVLAAGRGPAAVLAGSCSAATLAQVECMAAAYPAFRLDAEQLADCPGLVERVMDWAGRQVRASPVLIAASQPPDRVSEAQRRLGAARAAELVENALADVAAGLYQLGVRKFIVAGGETAGAVITRLGIRKVCVGPPLAPGVPWIYTTGDKPLLLALKSGNFGGPNLLLDAVTPIGQTAVAGKHSQRAQTWTPDEGR